jgi:hypothetical protein
MKKSLSWPMGLTLVYVSFVAALFVYLIFSLYQDVNLVTEDYYEQELKYQQHIDKVERTRQLSHKLMWQYEKAKQKILISISAEANPQEITGKAVFFRPSDSGKDIEVALNLGPDGRQEISISSMLPGLWRIKIFWNRAQEEYFTEGILVIE